MANRQKDKRSSNTLGDYATGADTLIGATQAAREAGFDGSMRSLSNGRVACSTCSAEYSASQYEAIFEQDRKSTRLNSSHMRKSRMPSSA